MLSNCRHGRGRSRPPLTRIHGQHPDRDLHRGHTRRDVADQRDHCDGIDHHAERRDRGSQVLVVAVDLSIRLL